MKQSPDTTLESVMVKLGFTVRCTWQKTGAAEDGWAWLECLCITGGPNDLRRERDAAPMAMVIVQTFKGGGWEVFRSGRTNSITDTIRDVMTAAGADPLNHLPEIVAALE